MKAPVTTLNSRAGLAHARPAGTRLALFCAALLPLLAACGGGSDAVCTERSEPYMAARNNPALRVPDGMTQPNRSEALAIPDSKAAQAQSGSTRCLDEPPSYFRSAGTVARSP